MEPRGLVSFRLTEEEIRSLDLLSLSWGLKTRSDTLRSLIERAKELPSLGEEALSLPPMLTASLEEMVENGWASTLSEAAARTIDRGLTVLAREYEARVPQLAAASHQLHTRQATRKTLERKGDELLKGTRD